MLPRDNNNHGRRHKFDWKPVYAKCTAWLLENPVTTYDLWQRLLAESLVTDSKALYDSFKVQASAKRNAHHFPNIVRDGTGRHKKDGTSFLRSLNWDEIIPEAARIVRSYDTWVTLRQLFYRLVAAQLIDNNQSRYHELAKRTAALRLEGLFPDLIDPSREILGGWGLSATYAERVKFWEDPAKELTEKILDAAAAVRMASASYARADRDGQQWRIIIAVEKRGLMAQLQKWFGELPIKFLAFGGQTSTPIIKKIWREIDEAHYVNEKLVVLYGGDYDPSGLVIDRSFEKRSNMRIGSNEVEMVRVALNKEQVEEYDLPINPAKTKDANYKRMVEEEGEAMQVELDALEPDTLREVFQDALDEYWNQDAFDTARELEEEERERINAENEPIAEQFEKLAENLSLGKLDYPMPRRARSKATPLVEVRFDGSLVFSNEVIESPADYWRNL